MIKELELEVKSFEKLNCSEEKVTTLRLRSTNGLEIKTTSDGSHTLLEYIKDLCLFVGTVQPPIVPGNEWTDLLQVLPVGTEITIAAGFRLETKPHKKYP